MKAVSLKRDKSALLFIDIKAAFDNINRDLLIEKLRLLQVPDWIVNILVSIF